MGLAIRKRENHLLSVTIKIGLYIKHFEHFNLVFSLKLNSFDCDAIKPYDHYRKAVAASTKPPSPLRDQVQKQCPRLILCHIFTLIYQWNGFCYFSAPQEEETESIEGKYIKLKRLLHWLPCNCQPSKSLSMTLFHFYTYNMPRKYLQRYWSFMRRIKRSPVDAPHKCWVMWVLLFSLMLAS